MALCLKLNKSKKKLQTSNYENCTIYKNAERLIVPLKKVSPRERFKDAREACFDLGEKVDYSIRKPQYESKQWEIM